MRTKRTSNSGASLRLASAPHDEPLRPHPGEVLRSLEADTGVRTHDDHSFARQISLQRGRVGKLVCYILGEARRFTHYNDVLFGVELRVGVVRLERGSFET